MTEFFSQLFRQLVGVFLEASPYILLGFAVAAMIQIALPVGLIQRFLGQGRLRSVFAASVLGIPLPLCSCSVLPTALALRKRGAGRGATVSFLVSTPETGVDSIALTYGLMDPLMAVYRPFAALVSALTAGIATEALAPEDPAPKADAPSCGKCGPEETPPAETPDAIAEAESRTEASLPMGEKLRRGFRGAFVEIFDETSHWMLAGLVISALIGVLLPAEIVTRYLSSGPVPMLLMLGIGIPLYICASASTPIAAALVLKGLSPGAALVFLLAGPATNIGSLAILSRSLGRRVMVIYITTIAVLSLALGAALDVLYPALQMEPGATAAEARHLPMWIAGTSAVIFAGLLFFSFRRVAPPSEFLSLGRGVEWLVGFRPNRRGLTRLGLVVLGLWALSTCFLVVPPGYRGLVQRFGALTGGPRGEGLHLRWPPPIGSAQIVPVDGVRRIELGFRSPGTGDTAQAADPGTPRRMEDEALFLTGDENLLDTRSVVQYRITDPERWVLGFSDPENALKWEAVSQVLEVVARADIDGIYTKLRGPVEDQVLEGLRRRCEELDLGVEIIRFSLLDVHAPPEVHAAFRDVASAQEDKQTAINVALRYQVETVNLARGEAAREVEVAKGFSAAEVHRARGESQSLEMRSNAFREHPVGAKKRLYLETVERALGGGRKIVRPGWTGSGGIDLWISAGDGAPVVMDDILRGSEVRKSERMQGERTQGEGE